MPSRREFLRASSATLAVVGVPAILVRRRTAADVVIRNGTVFDGSGAAGREMDVVISGGRITDVARRITDRGAVEIDARGRAVAPGFIDIHSHGDGSLWSDPRAESLVRQGITTIVVGQDGSSRAPREAAGGADAAGSFDRFSQLWASIDALRPAVNVASMIGLGTVRAVVIGGKDRPATAAELDRMTQMVRDAVADGACGASSGLEYTPGAFAPLEELVALCKPLASKALPYATHMRNEDDRVLESIDESIAVAKGAGCPLQIS